MERNLKELTLDKMIKYGYIEFYRRDIDFDRIREGYFSKGDVTNEVLLLEEQILSDKIYSLLECIVGETILDIRMVRFDSEFFKECFDSIVWLRRLEQRS